MNRLNLLRRILASLILLTAARGLPAAAPDPLDALRQTLATPVFDPRNPEELAFRRVTLEKHAKALSDAELGPALRLTEWRDQDRDAAVAAVDQGVRTTVVQRLRARLRDALSKGDATTRRAALTQIAELGMTRGEGQGLLAADFAAEVAERLKDKDVAVSRSAALALGRLLPPPTAAAQTLGAVLQADEVDRRRAAAEGIATWMRTLTELTGELTYANGRVKPGELVDAAAAALPVAGRCVADSDAQVRRSGLEGVRRGGKLFNTLIAERRSWDRQFGSPPDAGDPDPTAYLRALEQERLLLLPLEKALAATIPAVDRAASDADPAICRAASEALEAAAPGRRLLLAKAGDLPPFFLAKQKERKPPEDPLGPVLRQAVATLARLTSHKDVDLRLAALYALEEFGADAAPAAAALVQALQDGDGFVRWAAARALGKIAPQETELAVPGLGRVLTDENGDVRATAAAALERYGPKAKAAVPALAQAVEGKEAAMRILAMRALAAVGPEAGAAVPAVAKALGAPEPEVRFVAARTLARVGAAARPAIEALRKALDDPDENVRRTAAEVILGLK